MSGLVGHTMYAVLARKAAERRWPSLGRVMREHLASYVAGAYLGSDIQTMPEAVCVDTGREVGYGTVPMEKSPLTGGAVRPFMLHTPGGDMRPGEVHDRFYGRAHLVFGWSVREKSLMVPWDHLPDYFAAVCDDLKREPQNRDRALAYVMGWIVHVVSDSLIKGIHPGVDLNLIDGRYTPRNRPVQDLVTYHEIGIKEFSIDWPAIFRDLAATPVEPVQVHYMRCAQPSGELAKLFADGWKPEAEPTLRAVLAENRRWVREHAKDVLSDMKLDAGECSEKLRTLAGMNYAGMVRAAEAARFRAALTQIQEAVLNMFEAVHQRSGIW